MKTFLLAATTLFFSALISAKDFGVEGATYPILEMDALTLIENRLQEAQDNGEIDAMNEVFARNAIKSAHRPKPVKGLINAQVYRTFLVDMSQEMEQNIYDHQGNLVVAKGTVVNPLKHRNVRRHLAFIDGDNEEQVKYAIEYAKEHPTKIIMTNGEPFKTGAKHQVRFYFDQTGEHVKRFKITALPSVVYQDGLFMRVEEIPL